MSIAVNTYFTGKNGSAKQFVEEMESSATAVCIRNEDGNEQHEYFFSNESSEKVLLIESWRDQRALDAYQASPLKATLMNLKDKYDLEMKVKRYISVEKASPHKEQNQNSVLNRQKNDPAEKGQTDTASQKEQKESAAKEKKYPAVLFVDDMEVNQKIMASMLMPYGITIDYADSGNKCLEKCKEKDYDLIFMDQNMPGGIQGTETMELLKKHFDETGVTIPVICFTSYDTPGDRKKYLEAGFSAILGKPAHPVRVKELLEKLLGERFEI